MGWTIIQPTHHMCLTQKEKIFRLKIQKFISNNHVRERHHHLVAYAKFFLELKKTSGLDQWSVTLLDKYFQMVTVQVCLGFIYKSSEFSIMLKFWISVRSVLSEPSQKQQGHSSKKDLDHSYINYNTQVIQWFSTVRVPYMNYYCEQ